MSNDVNRECTGNHVIERVTDRSTDRRTGGSTAIRLRGGKNERKQRSVESINSTQQQQQQWWHVTQWGTTLHRAVVATGNRIGLDWAVFYVPTNTV